MTSTRYLLRRTDSAIHISVQGTIVSGFNFGAVLSGNYPTHRGLCKQPEVLH